jgi:hypothetical protein
MKPLLNYGAIRHRTKVVSLEEVSAAPPTLFDMSSACVAPCRVNDNVGDDQRRVPPNQFSGRKAPGSSTPLTGVARDDLAGSLSTGP